MTTPSANSPSLPSPPAIVVMGVSGSGKSAVGGALAERFGVPLLEGDAFHPRSNIDKMSSGVPLTDDDRWPWLDAIATAMRDAPGGVIVACSALKHIYRDRLRAGAGKPIVFLFLDGSKETIAARLAARKNHFMPPSLLASQFATLEPPAPGEPGIIRLSIDPPVEAIVAEAMTRIGASPESG